LKATKDFHGSVEHSSLTRAKLINENGVYIVGGQESSTPSLEESLSVEMAKKESEKQGTFFFILDVYYVPALLCKSSVDSRQFG